MSTERFEGRVNDGRSEGLSEGTEIGASQRRVSDVGTRRPALTMTLRSPLVMGLRMVGGEYCEIEGSNAATRGCGRPLAEDGGILEWHAP